MVPVWLIRSEFDQGRLEIVLAEFEPPQTPVQAVWPDNTGTPIRTRLFLDMRVARLATETL